MIRWVNRRLEFGCNMLARLAFVVWIVTITVLAVVPHSDDGLMVSSNVTPSGMEKHIVGYFLATLLFYYGFKRKRVYFVWFSGLVIFGYSVALEFVQFFLPYRTFNPYDILGNGIGILIFVAIWMSYSARSSKKDYSYLTEPTEHTEDG